MGSTALHGDGASYAGEDGDEKLNDFFYCGPIHDGKKLIIKNEKWFTVYSLPFSG